MHPLARVRAGDTSRRPRVVAIIPARFHSTRFPGKALADLAGRPMVVHVYTRAAAAPGVDAVLVATDDVRIAEAVSAHGGAVVMTRADHLTGSDRLAEVAAALDCDVVVNVQGDEPLIEPAAIAAAVAPLATDDTVSITTLRRPLDDPADLANPNVVKVVVDARGNALYFSRAPVPWLRHAPGQAARGAAFKHVGLYAYRRDILLELAATPPTPLELAESLEQLRALERGYRIRTVETAFDSIGVDTPADLAEVRRRLEAVPR